MPGEVLQRSSSDDTFPELWKQNGHLAVPKHKMSVIWFSNSAKPLDTLFSFFTFLLTAKSASRLPKRTFLLVLLTLLAASHASSNSFATPSITLQTLIVGRQIMESWDVVLFRFASFIETSKSWHSLQDGRNLNKKVVLPPQTKLSELNIAWLMRLFGYFANT